MDLTTLIYLVLILLTILILLTLILLVRLGKADSGHADRLINQAADELLDAVDDLSKQQWQGMHQLSDALQASIAQAGTHTARQTEQLQQQLASSLARQDDSISRMQQTVSQQIGLLDERMEKVRISTTSSLNQIQETNDRQLTEMRRTVDDKLTANLDRRLSESFRQVSQRLEQVYKGLGEMHTLANGVGDLKRVLSNVKVRGIWGEVQLSALLNEMLSPSQFDVNVAVVPGSQERVEFAIRLPGKDGHCIYLPIDSKFPQETYLRLLDAQEHGSVEAIAQCRKALNAAIRTEGKRISSKYIRPPYTTDFAIMFLPVEGLYAEAVHDMEAVESMQREQRVMIAGPSNLTALLNALQMGFRTLAIEQRTGDIWRLLGHVKTDFNAFEQLLKKTQQTLQQASDSIGRAVHRTQAIQKSFGAMDDLQVFPEPPAESLTATDTDPETHRMNEPS